MAGWLALRSRSIQKVSLRMSSAGATTAGCIDDNYLLIIAVFANNYSVQGHPQFLRASQASKGMIGSLPSTVWSDRALKNFSALKPDGKYTYEKMSHIICHQRNAK